MKRWAYTAALFAAFNVLDGTLLGHCTQHHRHDTLNRLLNKIQGFFSGLTRRRLRRHTFTAVVDPQSTINGGTVQHNRKPVLGYEETKSFYRAFESWEGTHKRAGESFTRYVLETAQWLKIRCSPAEGAVSPRSTSENTKNV